MEKGLRFWSKEEIAAARKQPGNGEEGRNRPRESHAQKGCGDRQQIERSRRREGEMMGIQHMAWQMGNSNFELQSVDEQRNMRCGGPLLLDKSNGRAWNHVSGPSYKSLGRMEKGKRVGPYYKGPSMSQQNTLLLGVAQVEDARNAEAQEGNKTQLRPQEISLSVIDKNGEGKDFVAVKFRKKGCREGKGKKVDEEDGEAGDCSKWEIEGAGYDGDDSNHGTRNLEVGETSVGTETSHSLWVEQSTEGCSEQESQDECGSLGVKSLQERDKICSDTELEQIRGWIERATEAWKITSSEEVQERDKGVLQCEPLAVLAPDQNPDGRKMVALDSKKLKMKASSWVMRRIKIVSRSLGVSCRRFEDEITDLFGRIEKANRQQSRGKRESGSRLHRELQKLKSTVNYDRKEKAGKQKGGKCRELSIVSI
ncbi:hypothetical protein F0562_023747 [Nyssa sinensis]|uniref:Uncharacterized protein n=1 Tax=Nyssa sinensis TaxID=561372 RepID=A0A5J5BHI8_9ASTE|nr:hypothetical protein F0562_023747 [Nyssa sinensis]